MTVADIAILAALGLSVLVGLWRGFLAEVLAILIWILAAWAAWAFGPAIAVQLEGRIDTPSVRLLLACAGCFVVVLAAGALVSFLLRKLVAGSGLSGSDRLLGMVFGLARGLALVTLAVLLLGFTPFRGDPWWQESRLLPGFSQSADWLGERLSPALAEYLQPNLLAPPVAAPRPPVPGPHPEQD